jgi:quinoprotein glucose dehydrogenase
MSRYRWCVLLLWGLVTLVQGSEGWVHYGGSQKGGQYSSLGHINRSNVGRLELAWTHRSGELGEGTRRGFSFQANPILVEEMLYHSTGSGIVMALDPASGKELWRFDPGLARERPTAETANRGVSSWIDPGAAAGADCRHRIFIGILDSRLIALDGRNGKPCLGFGLQGQVYLNRGVRAQQGDWEEYLLTSPPVIVGDTLVIGSAIGDNRGVELELGIVRGLDVRSGTERWRWDPIPRDPARPAHSEWKPDQVLKTGAANAWAPLSADVERGLVYVPTGSASPDFYGGERLGDNRHANSLVALDAATGRLRWAQQLVHHDVWDYDLPAQPALVELEHKGKTVPAVIQVTKMGLVFTFNRETGEPIFAIEERPVPQSPVPGEQLSATQPFPVAPPPIVRHQRISKDAWGMVLFDEWACEKKLNALRDEGMYTPPGIEGTAYRPGYTGGSNWGGLAFNPLSQTLVANAMELPVAVALIPRKDFEVQRNSGQYEGWEFARQTGTPYGMRRTVMLSPLGVPCTSPPWGTLTAIDMRAGNIKWQVPLGTIEDLAPALVPNLALGVPNMGGPIITASGLIFIAASADNYLRAFDADTGKELWKGRLPGGGQATPMSYAIDGRQYVVIAAGGHPGIGNNNTDHLVAFTIK